MLDTNLNQASNRPASITFFILKSELKNVND